SKAAAGILLSSMTCLYDISHPRSPLRRLNFTLGGSRAIQHRYALGQIRRSSMVLAKLVRFLGSRDLSRRNRRTLPAFLNFNCLCSLLRGALVVQSRGRKLQHSSSLAGDKACDHHNLAVRKFKRIVMRVWIAHIDLTKPCNLMLYAHLTEKAEGAFVLDVVVER